MSELPLPRPIGRSAAAVVAAAVACAGLVGCTDADKPVPVMDTTWQITGVYTGTDLPPELPGDSAGKALVVFGDGGIVGNTGCGQFRADSVLTEKEPDAGREHWGLSLSQLQFQEVDCQGAPRFFHDRIASILSSGHFSVTRDGTRALVVKAAPGPDAAPEDRLTAPALRLVAPGS